MRLPKQADLKSAFDRIMSSSYNGVSGVLILGDGPVGAALSAQTHPDEPEGLAAAWFLMENPGLITKGKSVMLTVHNVIGTEEFFAGNPKARAAGGLNWNRLPKNWKDGGTEALKRAVALSEKVYPAVPYILDFHGMRSPYRPTGMTLDVQGDPEELDRVIYAMPPSMRLRNVQEIQSGPMGSGMSIAATLAQNAVAIEVECGKKQTDEAAAVAVRSALSFLAAIGCLDAPLRTRNAQIEEYVINGAAMAPCEGYRVVDPKFLNDQALIAQVKKGELLAVGPNGEEILVPVDGVHLFSADKPEDTDPPDEICFFAQGPHMISREIVEPAWIDDLK